MDEVGGTFSACEKVNNFVVKTEIERPLGKRKHRWKNAIKMDLKQIGHEDVDLSQWLR